MYSKNFVDGEAVGGLQGMFLCNSESVSIVITTKFNDHDSIHALFHRNT